MSGRVHATAVVLGEWGVLIRGVSGTGKSALALALLGEATRRGWFARLVADDRVHLAAHGGRIVARGGAEMAGRIERRGEGLLTVPVASAARLRLVVDLLLRRDMPRLPREADETCSLQGVALPRLLLPAGDARADTPGRVLDILTTTDKN